MSIVKSMIQKNLIDLIIQMWRSCDISGFITDLFQWQLTDLLFNNNYEIDVL